MVIRLHTRPVSSTTTSTTSSQQKYAAPAAQVRASRDQLISTDGAGGRASPVVMETTHAASAAATSGERSVASPQIRIDDEFGRSAVGLEASKDSPRQRLPATLTDSPKSATRQPRFVKKPVGVRPAELRPASPRNVQSSRDDESPWNKEGSSKVVVTAAAAIHKPDNSDVGSGCEVVQLTSDDGHMVANRIAVFEKSPTSSDSSPSASSLDLTFPSTAARQKIPQSSGESRPGVAVSNKGPKRRAPTVSAGLEPFRVDTSAGDASVKSTVSPSQGVPGGPEERKEHVTVEKNGDQMFDTRL